MPHEAGAVYALHCRAIAGMRHDLVRQDDRDQFTAHADGKAGYTIGCFLPGPGLIGYGVLGLFSDTVDEMADVLQLTAGQRSRFALLDGAAVAPEWRNHRLHHGLIMHRVALAASRRRSLVAVTVAPTNRPSLRALLGAGFCVTAFAFMYEGAARLVMTKDLQAALPPADTGLDVALDDFAGHQAALAAGMRGRSYLERAGQPCLRYTHPAHTISTRPSKADFTSLILNTSMEPEN
jgi:hypothetical protein